MNADATQKQLPPSHPLLDEVSSRILNRVHSNLPLTQDITDHLFSKRGKRLRAQLALYISDAHGNPLAKAIDLAAIIELIHASTLLHDDVIDGSSLRRGIPTANNTFGNQAAILVGDYLYSMAFRIISELDHPAVLRYLADITSRIVEGEIMQLAHAHTDILWPRYLEIITAKTGLLFAASCHCSALLHGETTLHIEKAGLHLGIGYQIIDDLLDYTLNNQAWGKIPGDDLRDGKCTLPLILLSEKYPDWNIAKHLENPSEDFIHTVLERVNEHQILDQCRATASRYIQMARDGFSKLAQPEKILDLCDWIENRQY